MVNEGVLGKLKSQFRMLQRTCKSNKKIMKTMCLAFVIVNNICIEREDIILRNVNLTVDPATNKRRDRQDIYDLLDLTS